MHKCISARYCLSALTHMFFFFYFSFIYLFIYVLFFYDQASDPVPVLYVSSHVRR